MHGLFVHQDRKTPSMEDMITVRLLIIQAVVYANMHACIQEQKNKKKQGCHGYLYNYMNTKSIALRKDLYKLN